MALPHVWHWPARGSALDELLRRSERGAAMAVAAVGGSITAGINCVDGELVHQQCAWPARVARAFNASYQNLARGGLHTRSFLPLAPFVATQLESTLRSDEPLLLLVDFTVNDGYTIAGNEYKYSKGATAQMLAEVGHIARALEQLLRHLQPRRANVAIVGALHACAPCALIRDDYVKLFRHYEAPLLELTTWPKCSRWNFARCVHPNASWHSQLAATVVDGLRERALVGPPRRHRRPPGPLPSARAPLWPEAELPPVCLPKEATVHDAVAAAADARGASVTCERPAGCRLYADRANKPGWILEVTQPRQRPTVTFPVRFGAQPRLLISYLRSYEGFGDAQLTVSRPCAECQWGKYPIGHPYTLVGRHALRTSQATSEFFEASSTFAQDVAPTAESALEGRAHLGNAGGAGFAVPPNTSGFATVRLRRPSSSAASRFKVLAVVSC